MLCPTQPQWWKIETHESSKINLQRSPIVFPAPIISNPHLSIREFPSPTCPMPRPQNATFKRLRIQPWSIPIYISDLAVIPNHGTQHSPACISHSWNEEKFRLGLMIVRAVELYQRKLASELGYNLWDNSQGIWLEYTSLLQFYPTRLLTPGDAK